MILEQASFENMAAVTTCSDFGAQENKVCHCFPLFPHLFSMKWLDQMPWSLFFECWVLSQFFHSLFHLHQEAVWFLFTFCHKGCHLHNWGCWYFSQQSWFQLVLHPTQNFFHSFFPSILFSGSNFHHSVFQVTCPFFCISYSAIDFFWCIVHLYLFVPLFFQSFSKHCLHLLYFFSEILDHLLYHYSEFFFWKIAYLHFV